MSSAEPRIATRRVPPVQTLILTLLRLVIGWHLLYEGVIKLFTPGWTSAGYLSRSNWFLAPVFHRMAEDPATLRVVDALNVWGLIAIGLALLVGVWPRVASAFGAVLLLLYYAAFSPLSGPGYGGGDEGSYFVSNKTLIEMVALALIAILPAGSLFRLDRAIGALIRRRRAKRHVGATGADAQSAPGPDEPPPSRDRRELLQGLASLPLLGLFVGGVYARYQTRRDEIQAMTGATIKAPETDLTKLEGELPRGRLGNLEVSRLIIGNNMIGGWAHSRDLIYVPALFKAYNTERKVVETLELAEKAGINMMNLVNGHFPLLDKYNRLCNGKMQTMCQVFPGFDDLKTDIDTAIDNGTTTLYMQGAVADAFVKDGRVEQLGEAIEYARGQGYVVGIGAHSVRVPMACEQAGLNPDYYVKTFHHDNYWSAIPRECREEFSVDRERFGDHDKIHDNMFDLFPDQTAAFMAKVKKPWVAFKVLAAGAIHPNDGFRFAFEHGADFLCVGMFDFQIVEDVNAATKVLANLGPRERPWYA
jgi:uncharacterized membrane protein YphA (DoxX/SURF4 family)